MKAINHSILLFLVFFGLNSAQAQTGWIQTQINPGFGYNLTKTDSVLYASTMDGLFSTKSDGMPWFSNGSSNGAVYDVIKTETSILAATANGIYRSVDGGNKWALASSEIKCSGVGGTQGNQVFAKNGNFLFIHTWSQGIFRSVDDGLTWQLLTVGTNPGYSGDLGGWATCIYAFDGKIFIGAPGSEIGIYYSTDNGNSWNQAKSGSSSQIIELLFFYADKDTIYAGGFWGLYRSIDKGENWISVYRNMVSSEGKFFGMGTFRDIVFFEQNLIAAIDFKGIQISTDRGVSWQDFNTGLISDWAFAAIEIKPPYIWALNSFFGNAYRRSLAELFTSLNPLLTADNKALNLEQNYPNPVKSSTTFKYKIDKTQNVEFVIFDIFGNELITLVNSIQPAGEYEILFSVKNLTNGTYFYRLNAGNHVLTRKFQVTR